MKLYIKITVLIVVISFIGMFLSALFDSKLIVIFGITGISVVLLFALIGSILLFFK